MGRTARRLEARGWESSPRRGESASDVTGLDEKFHAYARCRDRQLRDELVEAHLGLANQVATRFQHRGEAHSDLFQQACFALVKAVDRFDPDRGVAFSAYATTTMLGELKRYFRDRGWFVRIPRRLQELYLEIGHMKPQLSQQLQRSPTVEELAEALGVSQEELLEAMEAGQAYRAGSLNTAVGEDIDPPIEKMGTEDPRYEEAEEWAVLAPLVASLPKREQRLIKLRFADGLTQLEIASRLGVSQMHVSRLLSRTLVTLRQHLVQSDEKASQAERSDVRSSGVA